jgi:hypothetical protein
VKNHIMRLLGAFISTTSLVGMHHTPNNLMKHLPFSLFSTLNLHSHRRILALPESDLLFQKNMQYYRECSEKLIEDKSILLCNYAKILKKQKRNRITLCGNCVLLKKFGNAVAHMEWCLQNEGFSPALNILMKQYNLMVKSLNSGSLVPNRLCRTSRSSCAYINLKFGALSLLIHLIPKTFWPILQPGRLIGWETCSSPEVWQQYVLQKQFFEGEADKIFDKFFKE